MALFEQWTRSPFDHSHVPFIATAGCPDDITARFATAQRLNVQDFGAIPNDGRDDLPAFRKAIAAAAAIKDSVVIMVPRGTWTIDGILRMNASRICLAGESRRESILEFARALKTVLEPIDDTTNPTDWSYRGGLIWVEGKPYGADVKPVSYQVGGNSATGSRQIVVPGHALAPGDWVHMHWTMPRKGLLPWWGHAASFESAPWRPWPLIGSDGMLDYEWGARIDAVKQDTLILNSPLPRIADATVKIGRRSGALHSIGIRDLTLKMPEHPVKKHLHDLGWNGIYVIGTSGFTVRNVTTINADNAFIIDDSNQGTIESVEIQGQPCHHAVSLRAMTAEVLVQDFVISASTYHGISVQDLSSRNVFRNGVMESGTFDAHRGMPFDTARINIVLKGHGSGGGAVGPLQGGRMVNWNITVVPILESASASRRAKKSRHDQVANPEYFPNGILAGINGIDIMPITGKVWAMPPGDKGCLVFGSETRVNPPDLYLAQREWWRNSLEQAGP